MGVVRAPAVVRALPLRELSDRMWTPQPDGSPDVYVTSQIEPSELALEGITPASAESAALQRHQLGWQTPELRPYQQASVEAIFDAWAAGKKAPLLCLATGTGKTIVAGEVIRRYYEAHRRHKIWFLAHREELLDQAHTKIRVFAPMVTMGIVQSRRNSVACDVTIASIDTLGGERRLEQALSGVNLDTGQHASPPGLVIIDEAHHTVAPKYMKVIARLREKNPNVLFLGLTATPGRADGTALDQVFDTVAYQLNVFHAIELGALVPPVGHKINLNVDLRVIPTENGDFKKAPLSKVLNQDKVRSQVCTGYQRYGENRKMLGFAVDVAHAHALAETFRSAGIASRAIDGKMAKKERDQVLRDFTDAKTRVLWSCETLTEGYDDPSMLGILQVRPTKSQALYQQIVGRGLRPSPGKLDCLVLDCVGNSDSHKLVQLASLAGFGEEASGDGPGPAAEDPPVITAATVGQISATEINFRTLARRRRTKWTWHETRYGWTVSLPNVGYFLISWMDQAHTTTNIHFHDMRADKRGTKPAQLNHNPLDFQMAYSLVEAELDRMFTAKANRTTADSPDSALTMPPEVLDALYDEQGSLFTGEELVRNDAEWRTRALTSRQRQLLDSLGVRLDKMPATAGEGADLATVLIVERDAKMREPATLKQREFIMRHKLTSNDEAAAMTKRQASALIVPHLKKLQAQRRTEGHEDFEADAPD